MKNAEARFKAGIFTLDDFATQINTVKKLGGIGAIMNMMPNLGETENKEDINEKEFMIKRHLAIISSMTPQERSNPDILDASRRKRIARGSGVDVAAINNLLKQYRQLAGVVKQINKHGLSGAMNAFKKLFK